MSSRLRVLLVGRHFWPHGSLDQAGYLIQLATGLHQHGLDVEVLTPRFATSWPDEIYFREIKVNRAVSAPRSDWSIGRYTRQMTNWIRSHAAQFDIVLVDSAREEATAAVEGTRNAACRCLIRVSGYGAASDAAWWQSSRSAQRCGNNAKSADQIIVSGAANYRMLLSDGFPTSVLTRIDEGFSAKPSISPDDRTQARRALAAINGDLHAPLREPVVLCLAPMQKDAGAEVLIQSVRHLVPRFPDLHFWFVGDGPERDSIFQSLRGDGVRSSIAMPGSFGDLEDVFCAASVFVQLSDDGLQHLLPQAISSGIPVVAADRVAVQQRCKIDTQASVLSAPSAESVDRGPEWFDPERPKTFRQAMRRVLEDLDTYSQRAAEHKRAVVSAMPFDRTVREHAQLFESMCRSGLGDGHSWGAVS